MSALLTLADVARYPRPGMATPRRLAFTPDGVRVAYLWSDEGTLVQSLWTHDLATGERRRVVAPPPAAGGDISLEEQLRRERSRTRELGVTDYAYAEKADEAVLLVPSGDELLLARGDGPLNLIPGLRHVLEARLDPTGAHLAYVRDGDLWVKSLGGDSAPRQLTRRVLDTSTNGLAEYVAQEEMGRSRGYWWSPDGQYLAFEYVDAGDIPLYPIVHQGGDALSVEEHRYPFAGQANATVKLGLISRDADPRDAVWMEMGHEVDIYLARVAFRPDGVLTAQVQTRDQKTLRLLAFDSKTGAATTLIEENGKPWVALSDAWRFLKSGEIIWSSEKSGYRHLYLHDAAGRELRALTSGEWMVTELAGVDEERRIAYVVGTKDGAVERHLYAVGIDDDSIRRVDEGAGWHTPVLSPDHTLYIDAYNSPQAPPSFTVRKVEDNAVVAVLYENKDTTPESLGLLVPELTTVQTRDGETLHAAVYASEETRGSTERRPLIVSVYGGPAAQMVTAQWALTVDLRAQYLAQQGFVVLKVDNRGTPNRGLAFERPIALHMGGIEVDDQVDGVRALAERPYVDSGRVGSYGWSNGGYMTLMLLLKAADTFHSGVAGAPVTFWDGYDTHYTERYMSTPESNPDGYKESSVLTHVDKLQGDLLIIHGLVDENVHARHTMRLITALIAADKPYNLVLFPEERHMPRDAAGLLYQEQRLVEHFTATLRG